MKLDGLNLFKVQYLIYYKILQKNYPDGKWTAKASKIMQKIGSENKPSKEVKVADKAKVEDETAEKKGWFSGWFGGNSDK